MSGNPNKKPRVTPKGTKVPNADKIIKETPASKRKNKEISPSLESKQPAKIPTITMPNNDKPLTIDAIRELFADQTKSLESSMRNEIAAQTKQLETSIRSEMKVLSDEMKLEFQAKITQLNDKIDANQMNVQQEINELKSNVSNCIEHNACNDDDMQRMLKLCELKINGIAYKSDEKLNDIFGEIAKLVQFDLTNGNNCPTLTRIYKYNRTTKASMPTPIVIVKFVANHIREDFYRLYLNKIAAKQSIMSEHIGLPNGTRIIIGENLTTKNYEIFVEAGKQKKQGKLCQVFTQNGLIQVKAVRNAKATAIRSIKELELFVLANPPASVQMEIDVNASTSSSNNNNGDEMSHLVQLQQQQLTQQQQSQQQHLENIRSTKP